MGEPDSEETWVFVFVKVGLVVCEGCGEELIVVDGVFELMELGLIRLVVEYEIDSV